MNIKQAIQHLYAFCLNTGFQYSCERKYLFTLSLCNKILWKGTAVVRWPFWEGEHCSWSREQPNLTRKRFQGIQHVEQEGAEHCGAPGACGVHRDHDRWEQPARPRDLQRRLVRDQKGRGSICCSSKSHSVCLDAETSQRYLRSRTEFSLTVCQVSSPSDLFRFQAKTSPEMKQQKTCMSSFSPEFIWHVLYKSLRDTYWSGRENRRYTETLIPGDPCESTGQGVGSPAA